jgi:ribulose-bisphosphate carboxylase large chain
MKFNIFVSNYDKEKYFKVDYLISSKTNLRDAAWNIAIGQSVGNPNVRNEWETEDLFKNHSCLVLGDEELLKNNNKGIVTMLFPVINIDWETDGISQLLCHIMGGHVDIDIVDRCRALDIDFPSTVKAHFLGPKYGISGFRKLTNQYNKPLFGSIVKPKIGVTPEVLLEMVKQMVDGGVDFIKEDEIMSNPKIAEFEKRVEIISNYLSKQSRKIVFCHTINGDPHVIMKRAQDVSRIGGNGIHINVYSGLGSYNSIRKLDLPLFIHLQSSGAKVMTDVRNSYSISWPLICKIVAMVGIDTIQTGMIGGYSNDDEQEILDCLEILRTGNVLPALSCGMHPGLIKKINSIVGVDYLANAGGSVHGHPGGTISGAKAMRQSIDKTYGYEFGQAITKWGFVK